MATTLYPIGYSRQLVTLEEMRRRYAPKFENESWRRIENYLVHAGKGALGIGSGWRSFQATTSAATRAGHSFHQTQTFVDGAKGCAAIDAVARNGNGVHRAPRTGEFPAQGSQAARLWGVHCNVGTPGQRGWEPWHVQPVELDGWGRWVDNGRQRPRAGYSIPHGTTAPPAPLPPPRGGFDDMTPMRKRVLDTRTTGPKMGKGTTRFVQLPILPNGTTSVLVNIQTFDGAGGYVRLYTSPDADSVTSENAISRTGDTLHNLCFTRIGGDKTLILYSHAPTHVIIDLHAYS